MLYLQAVQEERDEIEQKTDLIKRLNEVWSDKFKFHFEMLMFFIDGEKFNSYRDLVDIQKHRTDIDEDNFQEEWEKLMEVVPEEFIVEENESREAEELNDPELEELVMGWIKNSRNFQEG